VQEALVWFNLGRNFLLVTLKKKALCASWDVGSNGENTVGGRYKEEGKRKRRHPLKSLRGR